MTGFFTWWIPIEDNIYHSLVMNSETNITLSSAKAKKLSKQAEVIWEKPGKEKIAVSENDIEKESL